MTGCTARRYDQFETSPEAIEQELRPAVCERRQTDRLKANYSIDYILLGIDLVIQYMYIQCGINHVMNGKTTHKQHME